MIDESPGFNSFGGGDRLELDSASTRGGNPPAGHVQHLVQKQIQSEFLLVPCFLRVSGERWKVVSFLPLFFRGWSTFCKAQQPATVQNVFSTLVMS